MTANDRLLILIHGAGVVRAGQWARRSAYFLHIFTYIKVHILTYIKVIHDSGFSRLAIALAG